MGFAVGVHDGAGGEVTTGLLCEIEPHTSIAAMTSPREVGGSDCNVGSLEFHRVTADQPAAHSDTADHPERDHVPSWLAPVFEGLWSWVTGTKVGFVAFVAITYVIPYGFGILAIVSQIKSGGDFALLASVALVASTFASAQPAPTPAMGTLSMLLAGFMGAHFDPVTVGLAAGIVGTLGL